MDPISCQRNLPIDTADAGSPEVLAGTPGLGAPSTSPRYEYGDGATWTPCFLAMRSVPYGEPPSRHPCAWLLRRVFAADLSVCPVHGCGGRMRVVEIATKPGDIARVLAQGGRPRSRAPPPVRPPRRGQLSLALA